MKEIDLTKEHHSLSEVLTFAKSEAVLIHSPSGEDFVLEAGRRVRPGGGCLGRQREVRVFSGREVQGNESYPAANSAPQAGSMKLRGPSKNHAGGVFVRAEKPSRIVIDEDLIDEETGGYRSSRIET